MLRKDYLIRMIEDMRLMVSKTILLKQQRKHTEALWELDELYKRQFGLNALLLNSLSVKDIIEMFRQGDQLEADKLQSMALMMKEEGEIYIDAGKEEEGIVRLMKSLHLFVYTGLHGGDRTLWNLDREVDYLLEVVKGYSLPVTTERLLFRFEEEEGHYAQAENALFRLVKQDAIVQTEARAFYERLLCIDPDTLIQGGLPRIEVEEGLRDLSQHYEN